MLKKQDCLEAISALGASGFIGKYRAQLTEELKSAKHKLVWIHGAGCSGCTMSFLNCDHELLGTILKNECIPRGASGHWIALKNGVVSNYQIITPTTWNASPGGVMEKSLEESPICAMGNIYGIACSNLVTALHIVRSFDPCNGCAVHVIGSRLDSFKLHS